MTKHTETVTINVCAFPCPSGLGQVYWYKDFAKLMKHLLTNVWITKDRYMEYVYVTAHEPSE